MRIRSYIMLPLTLISLCACASTQTFTVGAGKDGATATITGDGSNGQVTVKGADGKNTATMTMGSQAAYPADFPFPQYPATKIVMVMDQSGTTGAECKNVSLESSDAIEKIVSHYKTWFSGNGWTVNAESMVSGVGTISAQSGKRTASIMVMPNAGSSSGTNTIQIIVSSEK